MWSSYVVSALLKVGPRFESWPGTLMSNRDEDQRSAPVLCQYTSEDSQRYNKQKIFIRKKLKILAHAG
jgi:hypothetical protein